MQKLGRIFRPASGFRGGCVVGPVQDGRRDAREGPAPSLRDSECIVDYARPTLKRGANLRSAYGARRINEIVTDELATTQAQLNLEKLRVIEEVISSRAETRTWTSRSAISF
jgi:hypothetical protein